MTRIETWKGIASYFNRHPTTVMRWWRNKGLPVHRLGGQVYALVSELEKWQSLKGKVNVNSIKC